MGFLLKSSFFRACLCHKITQLSHSGWMLRTTLYICECNEQRLQTALEQIEFQCGQQLFTEGEFEDKVLIDERLTCLKPMENAYYSKTQFKQIPRCYRCGMSLTDESSILDELSLKLKNFSIVYPTCDSCGPFICRRPKNMGKKRARSQTKLSKAKRPKPAAPGV